MIRAISRWLALAILTTLLVSCGGGGNGPSSAEVSDIAAVGSLPGITPFISFVQLRGASVGKLATIRYTIEPKPGALSKPVDVQYSIDALSRRNYVSAGGGVVTLPVFGLYAGHANRVSVSLQFADASEQRLAVDIQSAAYADPNGVYDRPSILTRRAAGSSLGFDYFAIKSGLGTPVVIDTDGEIRWVGAGGTKSFSAAFQDNGFVVGDQDSLKILRFELDGTVTQTFLQSPIYTTFHHNIDIGKQGLLAEMNATIDGVAVQESNLAEITSSGAVLKEWDFASIVGDYMRSQGDDPSAFVRPGVDWFHMNATTYDPRDDSIIASSRENFVIKVDYRSGEIIWILGDPTKYWYSFPSLRAKALRLADGGFYPIGQHATSITSDGLLMLFNDGLASNNQPTGTPVGESRAFSAVSAYDIDPVARTARETWRFEYGQTILSRICSSAYEAAGKSLLVSYAVAKNSTTARLVGLDAARNVVFDFEYPTSGCNTSWNAEAIRFDALNFR